jgi:hypothetical protein
MKPRLKLNNNGTLTVLQPGELPWDSYAAVLFIKRHYGSRMDFCVRYRLNYNKFCNALRNDTTAASQAGDAAQIRQMLGLRSNPSSVSAALVAAQKLRAERSRQPDLVLGFAG